MPKTKVEVYDKDQLIYPFIESDHVTFSNGMKITEMLDQSISMPKVTHEDSSFKVGVGDQDVSSSIVDSSVADMTIKGQTYQNILPEPTLRNKMIGKSMQRLNEGYDNIEVVDGVSKSAILSGCTKWANANGDVFDTFFNPITEFNFENGYLLTDGTLTYDGGHFATQFIDVTNFDGIEIGKDGTYYGKLCFYDSDKNFISWVSKEGTTGIVKVTSIPSNAKYIRYSATTKNIFIKDNEGRDLSLPLSLVSVKMPVLTTVGKNLFELPQSDKMLKGSIGKYIKLNLKPNTNYTYNSILDKKGNTAEFDFYGWISNDTNSNFTGYEVFHWKLNKTFSKTFNTGNDEWYFHVYGEQKGDDYRNYLINFQLEQGSTATSYEPYKSNILHTPEDLELRGIGDIKDELNVMTGELTQKFAMWRITAEGSHWSRNVDFIPADGYSGFNFKISSEFTNEFLPKLGGLRISCTPFGNWAGHGSANEGIDFHPNGNGKFVIESSKVPVGDLEALRAWLRDNPVYICYELATPTIKTVDLSILDQNGGTQENLHSFANGHLQVSSEAENSLLPSVQYEIPTKNSYHMDLMKANTLYTMKAKTVSGTFTIDGTSYNVNTNGTFTSPSSMTNKLLVMSNKTNEEVMILEGDVTDKTIPYFKGIKSAFEDEDKIEVLSTGKNLFDMNRRYDNVTNAQATVIQNIDEITVSSAESGTYVNANFVLDKNFFKGKTVTGSCLYESDMKGIGTVQINYRDTSGKNYYQSIKTSKTFTFPDEFVGEVLLCVYANNTNTPQSNTVTVKNIQLELGTKSTTYDSYKSNVSKIPLLSPLRSLPNEVCDELIIDRLNHKAKLIQRVGELVLNGNEEWTQSQIRDKHYIVMLRHCSEVGIPEKYPSTLLCSRFINQQPYNYDREGINVHANYNFHIGFLKNRLLDASVNSCKKWLSQNPTTVLYELNTPIITEIDLEGYPYAYKDGHIFLNSDIAPTTQITYSINQAQQIESANENLQRHEKEISYLQKLIAQYIQVEYESTLLSLKL